MPLAGDRDDGRLPFSFEPPTPAGICASCSRPPKPPDYDPAKEQPRYHCTSRDNGRAAPGTRGGAERVSSPVHKSETVDYGILLEGERVLLLDKGKYVLEAGRCRRELGNWHGWTNPRAGSLMAFVMMVRDVQK